MCGRKFLLKEPTEVADYLTEAKIPTRNLVKKKLEKVNIPPGSEILTLFKRDGKYELETTKWGIKFSDKGHLIFNSRTETIKESEYWFRLFNKNRAIIPMSGFYEWPLINKTKVMHQVFLKDSELLFAAALWVEIKGTICTSIITVPANEFMLNELQKDRMPVILTIDQIESYFDNPPEKNLDLCKTYPGKFMDKDRAKL